MKQLLRHLCKPLNASSRFYHCKLFLTGTSPTTSSIRFSHNMAVMGIETSCDDTAVCVLTSRRKVLSSRRYANREVQNRLGGICPSLVAQQHRNLISRFVDECLEESGMRLADLDGIAVSTRPGLVIALRVGIAKALSLARQARTRFVNVHHMQAHATIASLLHPELRFPYVCVLISGGHALITIAYGPENFELLASSVSGSPGECLDKIARSLPSEAFTEFIGLHPGAALEQLAKNCSLDGHLHYRVNMPGTNGPNMDFNSVKNSYLTLLRKLKSAPLNVENFCASVQHSVAAHLANKLHHCLEYINNLKKIPTQNRRIVVSGGVASNAYILSALKKIAHTYGYSLLTIPPRLCCDNAEMVAWNGILLINSDSDSVVEADNIPWLIPAQRCSPIGKDISKELPIKPSVRLSMKSIATPKIVFYHKPKDHSITV